MNQKPNNQKPMKKNSGLIIYLIISIMIFGVIMFASDFTGGGFKEISYSELQSMTADIKEFKITPIGGSNEGAYEAKILLLDNKSKYICYIPTEGMLNDLVESEYFSAEIVFVPKSSNMLISIIVSLLPYAIIMVVLFFVFRNVGNNNNQAFDFGKSRAQLNRQKTTTFKDVAGCDEEKEELEEIIDFLKNPKKYTKMGVKIPKGVLLVGPPGTGKTLLAKAVAGESSVPFFSISGADFVEMFVGVGAARVRDLFKKARENAPCIVFIDEIDAVGRQRGAGMGGGHDEREQTLNQLLVEMDGFSNSSGIIMIAATNRADVLDPALLRPGRFDRQIIVNLPDVKGREEILKVHARNKHFDETVKLEEIATRIPGFSGADIENLLNEAGLLAARRNKETISVFEVDEAIDRVMMGPAKKSKKYSEKEKKVIAFHEAGHAVIGIKYEGAPKVQKVTIIPRGQAGGYNLMLPEEETFLETKQSLLANITGLLAGRVAEEIVFNVNTTGAYNDFQRATRIARAMVTEYGMSNLGPIQYETQNQGVFLGRDYLKEKNFSDQIALEIDKEVREIITTCYNNAKQCILDNRELLDNIAKYLIEVETLTKENINEIVTTGKLGYWEEHKAKKALEETRNNEVGH